MSDKQGRGYSTAFEDHEGLLHRFTKKSYGIVSQFNVSADYDDLFQEACIGYMKALKGYKQELGFTFSAYMGRAVLTHLHRISQRMIRESTGLGTINLEDLAAASEDDFDVLERIDMATVSVDEQYAAAVESEARFKSLSPRARIVAAKIVRETVAGDREVINAREIIAKAMKESGIGVHQRSKVAKELYQVYEVQSRNAIREQQEYAL